jgi:hypothetical protein
MKNWLIRAAALGLLSMAALIGSAVGSPAAVAPVASAGDAFGAPLAAHVVARPIERDLTPSSRSSLHLVRCAAGADAKTACFAAGR